MRSEISEHHIRPESSLSVVHKTAANAIEVDDTFDHILEVTAHHEAVYAYYYMDEDNKVRQKIIIKLQLIIMVFFIHKVKVTEIFDMTDTEDAELQTTGERELNQQLQFDTSDWDATPSGRNCHVCLTIDWESSTSFCVCFLVYHIFCVPHSFSLNPNAANTCYKIMILMKMSHCRFHVWERHNRRHRFLLFG